MSKQKKLDAINLQIADINEQIEDLNDVISNLEKKAEKIRLKQQHKAIDKIEDLEMHPAAELGILKDEVMTEFKELVAKLKNIISRD